MKSKWCGVKAGVLAICLICQILFPFNNLYAATKSTAKKKKNNKKSSEAVVTEMTAEEQNTSSEEITKISTIAKARKVLSYFSDIDKSIVSGVENGSPSSIRQAMTQIRKSESEYTEAERVLINVATEIMKIVWQSEKISWDAPDFAGQTPYTGAIDFVKKGLFDSSTGNKDFLSTILPALVLFDDSITPQVLSQCEKALVTASTMTESSVLLDYMFGVLNEKKQNYNVAERYFSNVYAKENSVFEVRYHYASVELALGRGDSAFDIASILLNTGSLDALKLNAKIAYEQKLYDKAEEYVARVLQQTPNDLDFLLFRAKILAAKNDYIHAVSLLDMYARQNDTNIDYLLLRATVQIDWSKNTTIATETIEKALSLYPDNKDALLLAARVASTTDSPVAGKYADELVSKILETDPNNEKALLYALNGLIRRSSWQNAYEISKKLVAGDNPSAEIVSKHVEICLELGKKTEALNVATTAYEKTPDDEIVLQSYILAQISAGNKAQSLELINSLLDSSTPKMKSYLYYRRSFLQGTENAQLADLRSSLIANPRNSDSLFRLYEVYFEKSDYRKAQYYLKQVVALNPNDSSVKKLNESLTKLLQ